jgi:thiol:disulfide interchange protein
MAEKQLTAKQKQTKYRALQYTTFGCEFLSIFTPFIVMGCVNAQEWFYNENGWKVGLGGTLALALLGIAVFLVGKKKEDEKITGGYITLIVGWFAVAFIFMLLADIMSQITTIMMFGGLGLLGAFGLDMTSKEFKKKADAYKETIAKAKQDVIKEEVEQELKQKGDIRF